MAPIDVDQDLQGAQAGAIVDAQNRLDHDPEDSPGVGDKIVDFLERAGKDISDTEFSDLGRGTVLGLGIATNRFGAFLGETFDNPLIKHFFGFLGDLQEAELQALPTETSKVAGAAAPFLAGGIATLPVSTAAATAMGLGRLGTFFLTLGGNMLTDAGIAFTTLDPEKPNLGNLLVELAKTSDSDAVELALPLFEFLAIDDSDPAAVNRLRNAAIEGIPNMAFELGILLPKYAKQALAGGLNKMRKGVQNGDVAKLADRLIGAGNEGDHMRDELYREGAKGLELLHGGGLPMDPRQIEVFGRTGAREFGAALKEIESATTAFRERLPDVPIKPEEPS